MENKGKRLDIAIGAIIILIFIGFSLADVAFIGKIDRYVYDKEMSITHKGDQSVDNIVLIDIDKKSLSKLGQWPLPRLFFADIINILNHNGVKLIGLNIPFPEKETVLGLDELRQFQEKYKIYPPAQKDTSLRDWTLENLEQIEKILDSDQGLLESMANSGSVILPTMGKLGKPVKNPVKEKIQVSTAAFLSSNKNLSSSVEEKLTIQRLLPPFSDLAQSALGLGHTNLTIDDIMDGRLHPMFIVYNGSLFPSLPLRLAISYFNEKPREVIASENQIKFKNSSIPLFRGSMLIKIINKESELLRFSFVDLLMTDKEQPGLRGKIAIIGMNYQGSPTFSTSFSSNVPESDLTAQILGSIINNSYITRPPYMPVIELALIFIFGAFITLASSHSRIFMSAILSVCLVIALLIASFIMFSMFDIWFKPVSMIGCVVIIFLYTLIMALLSSERFSRESFETSRMLGLSFQSQGQLDQAFEKFKKLPLNDEAKELIYNIGLAFEKKRWFNKALAAYEYINQKGEYKDIQERIIKIKAADKSSTMGSFSGIERGSVLSEVETSARSKVGRYEVLGELGKGSMGLVYKAKDPKINRLVAIKTIRFSDEFDEDVIDEIKERFFREAEIAGQLSHPSIVTIHDVGYDKDLTYMAMEYLEGEDLEKYIIKRNLLPLRRVLDIISKTADALGFAHKSDVIHRDIKPANIMLLKNGQIKVTDFGIAKAISSSRTKTGVILGTPNYMSPEQIMGQKIDARSDIFSLGVLFFQLITGELPFHGENLSALLYQITQVKHPSPRDYNPKIPKICEQIVDKAMAKNPGNRFKNAAEMAKVLRMFISKIDQARKKGSSNKQPLK